MSEDEQKPLPAKVKARRFGDEEVRSILERAADMQVRAGVASDGPEGGLTLDDLRQIAKEAGIDPRFVDLATAGADAPVSRVEHRLAGGAVSWQARATVPGVVADADRDQILRAIRSVMGHKGEVADVYGRMEWSHDDGTGAVIIGLSSHDGETEIDATASKSGEAGMIHGLGIPFGGIFAGATIGGLLGISGPLMLPIIGVTAGAAYGVTRLGWSLRAKWWERRIESVVQRMSSVVSEVATIAPPQDEEES